MRILRVSRLTTPPALLALVFGLTPAAAAATAAPEVPRPAADSETVELPTLTVTDTRELPQPEKWRYTKITGFEVISSASDRETKKLLRDFEIFRMALGIAWKVEMIPPPPSAIILCGRRGEFAAFVPPQERATSTGRTSLTLNNREQAFMVLDLHTKIIDLDPIAAGTDLDATGPFTFDVDHYKQLYREYVRYLFSQATTRQPAWMEEGICQIVMSMEFDRRVVIFGKLDDPNSISPGQENANALNAAAAAAEDTTSPAATAPVQDLDFNAALRQRGLLPFNEFFGVTRDSETARNPLGNNVWAKQCYAFVHMCRYSMSHSYKKQLETFAARTAKEPATEALFEECFGKPYKKVLGELRSHINFTDYTYEAFKITGERTLEAPPPEMRDATEGEAMRMKGDAFRLAGKTAGARDLLTAAYIRGERDLSFLSTLGQAELAAGNQDRARKFLETSALKTTRPSVLVDLARLRLDEAKAGPAGTGKKLSDAQLVSVLKLLFTARTLPPSRPDVYTSIADAWLAAESSPKIENLSVLTEGLQLFPYHAELVYSTAALHARIGNVPPARALAEHGEKIAADNAARSRFTQLKASLPPSAAPAP